MTKTLQPSPVPVETAFDPKNATYTVEGLSVSLHNGVAQVPAAPGSASKVTTRYFGNDATGDLNGDGRNDTAFLIAQEGGGSGVFYYVAAAINTPGGYKVTNTILLGDRIAPQTTEIRNGEVLVNYAERKAGEPMTAEPSVGVTKMFKIAHETILTEVVQ